MEPGHFVQFRHRNNIGSSVTDVGGLLVSQPGRARSPVLNRHASPPRENPSWRGFPDHQEVRTGRQWPRCGERKTQQHAYNTPARCSGPRHHYPHLVAPQPRGLASWCAHKHLPQPGLAYMTSDADSSSESGGRNPLRGQLAPIAAEDDEAIQGVSVQALASAIADSMIETRRRSRWTARSRY